LDQQSNRGLSWWDAAKRVGDGSLAKDLRDHRQSDEPDPVHDGGWKQLFTGQENDGEQSHTAQ
jgi:hypothetical protein